MLRGNNAENAAQERGKKSINYENPAVEIRFDTGKPGVGHSFLAVGHKNSRNPTERTSRRLEEKPGGFQLFGCENYKYGCGYTAFVTPEVGAG